MSNQTAIEWLKDKLPSIFIDDKNGFYRKLFDQAKAMEKEQIIAAIDNFQTNQWGEFLNGDEYYEENYGNETDSR